MFFFRPLHKSYPSTFTSTLIHFRYLSLTLPVVSPQRIGSRGTQNDQFNNPLYVTVGQHNQIIVSDSDNHCVKILSSSGRFLGKFGSQGSGEGQLSFPRGICTDMDGNVIVADRNNHRVSIFSSKGRFMRHLLTKSDGIRDPYGVAFTMTRNLVLTESGTNTAALKMFQM